MCFTRSECMTCPKSKVPILKLTYTETTLSATWHMLDKDGDTVYQPLQIYICLERQVLSQAVKSTPSNLNHWLTFSPPHDPIPLFFNYYYFFILSHPSIHPSVLMNHLINSDARPASVSSQISVAAVLALQTCSAAQSLSNSWPRARLCVHCLACHHSDAVEG